MKYRHALLIILIIIIADQWLKIYVKTHFYYGEEIRVIGSWFRMHFIENEGMAYGMKLSESGVGKLALSLFRLLAVVFGFFLLNNLIKKGYSKGAIICGALILAGALGNLIDSMFYGLIFTESSFHIARMVPWGNGYGSFLHGRVVDMLYFPIIDTRLPEKFPIWGGRDFVFFEPVFNIADAAISTGVLILIFFQKRLIHKAKPAQAAIEH